MLFTYYGVMLIYNFAMALIVFLGIALTLYLIGTIAHLILPRRR